MGKFLVLGILACAAAGDPSRAATETGNSPVLVELFTSEGCSSCPPVDAALLRMDASQPVPGAQLIVLSEHVDYWNHDGWSDPYSSSLFTGRQNAYVRALKLSDVYTPQLIVDGSEEIHLTDPQRAGQILEKAAKAAPAVSVRIKSVTSAGRMLRARIESDTNSEAREADIYVAIALNHAESQVSAGENSGHRLTHVAVVEYLKKIGRVEPGKTFAQDFETKIKDGTDPGNLRIVAFVQEPGPGRVLGAALKKGPFTTDRSRHDKTAASF